MRVTSFQSRWTKWLGICAVAGLVLIAWSARPNPSSIAYHLRRLEALRPGPFERPSRWQEWLSWKAVQWLSHGGQSVGQWMVSFRNHEKALVTAGYYETRWVWVEDHGLDTRSWKKVYPGLTNTVIAKTRYTITFNGNRPHELRLIGRQCDLDEFEGKLHALESQTATEQAK